MIETDSDDNSSRILHADDIGYTLPPQANENLLETDREQFPPPKDEEVLSPTAKHHPRNEKLLDLIPIWEDHCGAHQVFVSVDILSLSELKTNSQSFESRFIVKQQFMMTKQDRRILDSSRAFDMDSLPTHFQPEWLPPPLSFPKAIEIKSREVTPVHFVRFAENLFLEVEERIHLVMVESLELRNFPFDCQDFSIDIRWDVSNQICQLWPISSQPNFVEIHTDRMALAEWEVHPPLVEFFTVQRTVLKDLKLTDENHTEMRIRVKLKRMWTSYMYQVFVVLMLISATTLFTFTLDEDSLTDRLALSSTMLLTAVAFQLVVSGMVPKLKYLTVADRYVFGVYLFIFFIMLEATTYSYLGKDWWNLHVFHGRLNNEALLFSNIILWFILQSVFILLVLFVVLPSERRKLHMDSVMCHKYEQTISHQSMLVPSTRYKRHNFTYEDGRTLIHSYPGKKRFDRDTITASTNDAQLRREGICGIYRAEYYFKRMETFIGVIYLDADVEMFCLRKVTGDDAGYVAIDCSTVPKTGGPSVSAIIKARTEFSKDINQYTWSACKLNRMYDKTLLCTVTDPMEVFRFEKVD